MPLSVYHTTKEIDSSKVCFDIKPIDSSVEPVRLNDVMAVPDLNMSAVNVAQLNALCNNYDHLSHEKYQATLDADLEKGYVVKVHDSESLTDNVSFLPHHPVTNENKPGKVHRVANASSIFQGQSLNSNLLKGPDLLSNLTGVIMRFRENRIALCADIEQMYMQVKVDPKDRPYLRFLWNNSGHIETYEHTSHIFWATDSPCIASYALRRSAQDNAKTYPSVQKVIERNVYVEDLFVAVSSPNEATNIVHDTRKVLASGGFNLTKWNSNSHQVLDLLNPDIRLNPETSAPQSQKDVHLPRKLFNEIPISLIELHTFTDASELVLSAVSYLRIEHIGESVSVAFVIGKARVAPLKRMTIPNLELRAAVYGAQLAQFVRDEMDIEIHKQVFWSDSTTVLYWLRTPEIRHRIVIANTLAKILDNSSAQDWFYISSTRNSADDGTRGYNVHLMNVNSRWCRAVVKQTVRQCIPCRRMIQEVAAPKWLTSQSSDYQEKIIKFFKPQA
ncbi:uncharacterized protein LOC142344459 [Convolutriloba macropyga]|uniref:uncharacterized protein LOC142344459 n=1 Tax=Convolutriloba macropyga TaxID=536237 RepID=UPI003F522021